MIRISDVNNLRLFCQYQDQDHRRSQYEANGAIASSSCDCILVSSVRSSLNTTSKMLHNIVQSRELKYLIMLNPKCCFGSIRHGSSRRLFGPDRAGRSACEQVWIHCVTISHRWDETRSHFHHSSSHSVIQLPPLHILSLGANYKKNLKIILRCDNNLR